MNKVLLTGRICKDPEIRYSQSGIASVSFSLAVTKNKDESDFIPCKAFAKQAEFISTYIKKGNLLAIEGRIQTGQFTKQDGSTAYTYDVVIDRVESLTPKSENQQVEQEKKPAYKPQNTQQYKEPTNESFPSDEDLPF